MNNDLLKNFAKPTAPERMELFGNLDSTIQELILAAINVRKRAYAPYSNFKVGSAFYSKSGKIFDGCNVENAAFTPSACAERTALTKAISEGEREFTAGAVVATAVRDSLTTPCGVCRQFIREFASTDIPIYVAQAFDQRTESSELELQSNDPVLCTSIYHLLPYSFVSFNKD